MINFFFYNLFLNELYINRISNKYIIYDGLVNLNHLDESNLPFKKLGIFSKNNLLNGKLVCFYDLSLEDIILKINEIIYLQRNKIINLQRNEKYIIENINVQINNKIYNAYIIY